MIYFDALRVKIRDEGSVRNKAVYLALGIASAANPLIHFYPDATVRLRGRGLSFEELRHYQPGDDVRLIDWRATARRGSAHVRVYNEERERPVLVVVDQRFPMFFGSRRAMKSVVAAELAALGRLADARCWRPNRGAGVQRSGDGPNPTTPESGTRDVVAAGDGPAESTTRLEPSLHRGSDAERRARSHASIS